jgi:hypothetical protein
MNWQTPDSTASKPEPPSFEPWLGRVRLIRAWAAAVALVLVVAGSYTSGVELADAVMRGIIVAIVAYFIAWGSALWICSELYFHQIRKLKQRMAEHEAERVRQLQAIYKARLESIGTDVSNDPLAGNAPLTREAVDRATNDRRRAM